MDDRFVLAVRRGRRAVSPRDARDAAVVGRHKRDLAGLCREAQRGGITRRQFIERALVLGLSATAVGALASACGGEGDGPSPSPTGTVPPMDETMPAEIVLYNWTDYIHPGVKKDFELQTGIAVKEVYFSSGEELLAKMQAGAQGYDVMVNSDYMVSLMRDHRSGKLLEPLDMRYLPDFQYVGAPLRDPVYDDPAKQDGLRYSAPYFYGTSGYCQRLDRIPEPQSTWEPLFDPKNAGEIQQLDDERECLGMALKSLGYSVNSQSQEELDEATAKLIEQKPLVATYDSVNMKRAMVEGTIGFIHCWDGDVLMALDQLEDEPDEAALLHYVLPEEGYVRWCDALTVPVGNNSRYGAHLFIDYLMDPTVAGKNASWVWYLSPIIPASWEHTSDFALTLKPSDEELARGEQIADVGEFATAYGEAWRRVKSA